MILIETSMLTLLICTCLYVTIADFKTGLIPNKALLFAAFISSVLNIVYYGFAARQYIFGFSVNLAVSVLFSVLLYAFHFWGAGDSKMLIFIVYTLPAGFYVNSIMAFPTLNITVYTFAIAFIYLIFETVFLGIVQKNFFKTNRKITVKSVIETAKNYFISYVYIFFFGFVESILLKGYMEQTSYFIPLLNFFVIFAVFSVDLFKKWYIVLIAVIADAALLVIFRGGAAYIPPFWNILLITAIIIFKNLAEKYNYKTVPTSEIKAGTVLALRTVLLFSASRVKGLPHSTTEDFRSRITEDEAESIKRWENSKTGKQEIVIVRKLPFAVFITIGTIAFLALRRWVA